MRSAYRNRKVGYLTSSAVPAKEQVDKYEGDKKIMGVNVDLPVEKSPSTNSHSAKKMEGKSRSSPLNVSVDNAT